MHFTDSAFDPFVLTLPTVDEIPLICDSPHSGSTYPADFNSCLPISILRSGEDAYIDELWSSIPDVGGALLAANFPRTYIDPNRDVTDIDPGMLAEPWPSLLNPTHKSIALGHGLIWRVILDRPIYDRKLWVAEIENRIGSYYQPYMQALTDRVNAIVTRFGRVWHLNLHSMPSGSYAALGIKSEHSLADFVLGDRDGVSCDPTLVGIIEDFLCTAGYKVARNDPYKGAALVTRFGHPAENRNSLQIEINRKLYMDETSYEKNAGYPDLKDTLDGLCLHVAQFIRSLL